MKRLYRSESDIKVAGVCAGIAEVYGLDPTLVRLIAVIVGLLTAAAPVIVAYCVAWWIVPTKSELAAKS